VPDFENKSLELVLSTGWGTAGNLYLMRILDEQYMKILFYSMLKRPMFLRSPGYPLSSNRVRKLLKVMGLESTYQKLNHSPSNTELDSFVMNTTFD
jgi:hypothetical protein